MVSSLDDRATYIKDQEAISTDKEDGDDERT